MKNIGYALVLFVGLLLSASESATFLPNLIGLLMLVYSTIKLDLYNSKK